MPNIEAIFTDEGKAAKPGSGKYAEKAGSKRAKKKRGFVFLASAMVVAAAIAAIYMIVPKSSKSSYTLKTWNEAVVSKKTITNTVSSSGIIELKNKETILSPTTSSVSDVFVSEGDTVKKGQALAQLVTDELDWELEKAQASYDEALRSAKKDDTSNEFSIRQQDVSIKTAERKLGMARESLVQTQGLFDRNIASSSELADAKNAVLDATDTLDLARLTKEQTVSQHELSVINSQTDLAQKLKTIRDLKQSIADCTIRSGSSGKVYSLLLAKGDRVASYAMVAVVADPADIRVGIDVAENRINEVRLGNPVLVTIGDTAIKGTVTSIASSATSSSSSSSTIRVNADFGTIPPNAIVGGSVSAEIQVGVIEDALVLPRGPFLSSGNYSSVYVIQADNSARKQSASFGITEGNYIQVLGGLEEGDRVISGAYQEYIHLPEINLSK
ncbi:hypothetical protein MASR2M29_04400 [Spirochaetota bacterium]